VSLAGGGLAVDSFQVDATAGTGVNPVVATAAGLVSVGGGVVANADIPLQSISRAPNEYDLEVQVAKAVSGAPGVKTGAGVATFDDTKFTVDANGYVTAIGAGAGGIVYLATVTAAASASVEFTALIDATYNTYLFVFENILPSELNDYFQLQTSSDGGVSYDSGATDYSYTVGRAHAAITVAAEGNNGISYIRLSYRLGTGTDQTYNGLMYLHNPSNAVNFTSITSSALSRNAPNTFTSRLFTSGDRRTGAAVDALKFFMSTGNIASGTIKMYGMTTPL